MWFLKLSNSGAALCLPFKVWKMEKPTSPYGHYKQENLIVLRRSTQKKRTSSILLVTIDTISYKNNCLKFKIKVLRITSKLRIGG